MILKKKINKINKNIKKEKITNNKLNNNKGKIRLI